jgi:AcrR family transcriptional regulator
MTQTAGRARGAGAQQSSPVRERILDAANEHFYAEGIRAVSADKLIAAAGVSKVTFYRHFPSKDDLVVAYLEGRAAVERQVLQQFRADDGDPCATLLAIARGIGGFSCSPGFRGCPFINAAAEFADPAHPARKAIAAHRAWFASFVADLLREMSIDDPEQVADQLIILRDGAMVSGYLGPDPATLADTLVRAGRAVINDAGASSTPARDTSR